jgi:hypothetical protein
MTAFVELKVKVPQQMSQGKPQLVVCQAVKRIRLACIDGGQGSGLTFFQDKREGRLRKG